MHMDRTVAGTAYADGMPRAVTLPTAGFLLLAVLVQATDFDILNSFARRHLQPLADGHGHPTLNSLAEALVTPAAPSIAVLAMAAAAGLLWRTGRRHAALAWPAALAGGLLVELVSKLVVQQHRSGVWHGYGLTLDSSFPSGHMLRAIVLAGVVASLWPRLGPWLAGWCVAVATCLQLTGWHLPTDIAGGVLAGLALAAGARSIAARESLAVRGEVPAE